MLMKYIIQAFKFFICYEVNKNLMPQKKESRTSLFKLYHLGPFITETTIYLQQPQIQMSRY